MPPVSEAQRRAMYAAASGHSTLGIPRKVGREFIAADKGGKLPSRLADMQSGAYGLQGIVPGIGPPDSELVTLRVTPGELVTVTPPGRGLGPRDPRGKDSRSGTAELETILRYMNATRR